VCCDGCQSVHACPSVYLFAGPCLYLPLFVCLPACLGVSVSGGAEMWGNPHLRLGIPVGGLMAAVYCCCVQGMLMLIVLCWFAGALVLGV
jgi:hypothetical protein